MALDLGTLTAHLALDTSGWTASLRAVDASVNQVGSSLSGTLDVLTSWAAQAAIALAGVGLAAGTVYGGVLGAGAQMETFANQLTTMMGSAEAAKARPEASCTSVTEALEPFVMPGTATRKPASAVAGSG